jgi:hypothetical protein
MLYLDKPNDLFRFIIPLRSTGKVAQRNICPQAFFAILINTRLLLQEYYGNIKSLLHRGPAYDEAR